eukprot:scaffold4385_cov90-Skeletonema_marinoi.AAC.1
MDSISSYENASGSSLVCSYRSRCIIVGYLMRHLRRPPAFRSTLAPYRISRSEYDNQLLLVSRHSCP